MAHLEGCLIRTQSLASCLVVRDKRSVFLLKSIPVVFQAILFVFKDIQQNLNYYTLYYCACVH